jgi:aspartate aminotransferase-like enzyme
LIASATRTYGQSLGLCPFATHPSPTITAFALPETINGEKVQFLMENKHGVTIGGGQEHLKGKIIRIGHMGAIESHHIEQTFEKLALTLNELGHKCEFKRQPHILANLKPLPKVL